MVIGATQIWRPQVAMAPTQILLSIGDQYVVSGGELPLQVRKIVNLGL
jgi:hypothetical protein